MVERLRSLVWYAFLLALFMVLYHVGSSYTLVVVDDDLTYMQPTLRGGAIHLLNRRRAAVKSLEPDDLIVFRVLGANKELNRMFGRVLAVPKMTVSVREGRLLVNGDDAAALPPELSLVGGVIVPRDTVFVVFDASSAPRLSLARRLVPYRNIIGRLRRK